jgi:hypothetical protein
LPRFGKRAVWRWVFGVKRHPGAGFHP